MEKNQSNATEKSNALEKTPSNGAMDKNNAVEKTPVNTPLTAEKKPHRRLFSFGKNKDKEKEKEK